MSSMMNSVSESGNNSSNFFVRWYSLLFCSVSQTLSSCLIQVLVWCVLFHWSVGQIMVMQSKCLLYYSSIKFKIRWLFPQPVGPVNVVVENLWYSLSFLFAQYNHKHNEHTFWDCTKTSLYTIHFNISNLPGLIMHFYGI